jgi:hypothetical protein
MQERKQFFLLHIQDGGFREAPEHLLERKN